MSGEQWIKDALEEYILTDVLLFAATASPDEKHTE